MWFEPTPTGNASLEGPILGRASPAESGPQPPLAGFISFLHILLYASRQAIPISSGIAASCRDSRLASYHRLLNSRSPEVRPPRKPACYYRKKGRRKSMNSQLAKTLRLNSGLLNPLYFLVVWPLTPSLFCKTFRYVWIKELQSGKTSPGWVTGEL